jgi:uncharacterized membrane protein YebE (DUF533 family)
MATDLKKLVAEILEDGVIDAREVAILRETLYADGVIDREEAEILFQLNDAATGKENAPAWAKFFVAALTDHVLKDDVSPGVLDDDEAGWLIGKIEGDGQVDATELALLVNITAKAVSCTDAFNAFVLASLKAAILEDGIIDDDEVAMLRSVVYGAGGGGGAGVDRDEANFLFELNDAVSGKENAAAWGDFFVEAITGHVLEDDVSPGVLDQDESAWLISQIEGDGQVDEVELALLVSVTANATDCTESFNAFVLNALKASVLEDGVIDDHEVEVIRAVVQGSGGGGGEGIDRAEADFLFTLNDAVSGNENASSWTDLFVEAIASHVLEDEESPGEIDQDEAAWLIGKIEGDGTYDAVELALLARIKRDATSIHESLRAKMDAQGV